MPIRGRCVGRATCGLVIRRLDPKTGLPNDVQAQVSNAHDIKLGDIVEVRDDLAILLTPNRSHKTQWMERVLDPRRLHAVQVRREVENGIREFFLNQGFLETRTPLLVPCPGMETHIRPFKAGDFYLPTSPEFAMKRLLVGGLEKIFQICPAFRDEPRSITHHPEFTMLEWYRAYAGIDEIMRDTEELFASIATKLFGKPAIPFQGREISVAAPWPRLKVRELFLEKAGVDLVSKSTVASLSSECRRLGLSSGPKEAGPKETWDDLYFKIWLNLIEPHLPSDRAVFVIRYPKSQAALAVIDKDPDGSEWAKRFEVYAGGFELGNAFEELTDPVEQRRRFEKDMELRTELYGEDFPKSKPDEDFLDALSEGMPPSGGIAIGVDRMVMLFADEMDIEKTFWLRSGC
jgi:lysyl-tRNA synthetase class 2